jgi:hypothetical protein
MYIIGLIIMVLITFPFIKKEEKLEPIDKDDYRFHIADQWDDFIDTLTDKERAIYGIYKKPKK